LQRWYFSAAGMASMSHHRIMLVDDHEVVRLGLKSILEKHHGMEVVAEASTGAEAVEKAVATRPDVVLLDIRLPGQSGIDVCQSITQKLPETRVIMLTSYAEDDMLFAAIRAGASGYLLKQIGANELVQAIERVGRGDALLDPAVTRQVFTEMRKVAQEMESSVFSDLTPQEMHVLQLVAEGKTNREIAQILFLGEGTARNYVSSILSKLNLSNRAEAAVFAVQHNLKAFL
jgi:two-component system, NarL family, response regulator DevR